MRRNRTRRAVCRFVGHNDKPLASRINDGPWILHGVDCRRCYRIELFELLSAPKDSA